MFLKQALCRCPDARIIVDGAHALLALPLNIPTLDVDYYVSNCHKWFCGPKGTAFMYVKEEHQPTTHPLVISHGWGSGFSSEFVWQGCFVCLFFQWNRRDVLECTLLRFSQRTHRFFSVVVFQVCGITVVF